MFRINGDAGTGNVIEAVRHMSSMNYGINKIITADVNSLTSGLILKSFLLGSDKTFIQFHMGVTSEMLTFEEC